ncbi:MAG: hypothetical protein ACK4S0_11540, partial [Sediminibacterium sp.]
MQLQCADPQYSPPFGLGKHQPLLGTPGWSSQCDAAFRVNQTVLPAVTQNANKITFFIIETELKIFPPPPEPPPPTALSGDRLVRCAGVNGYTEVTSL